MRAKTSSLGQKVGASAVNCSLVMMLALPLYPALPVDLWKLGTIAIFFLYNVTFRARCIGMRLMHTYIEPPTSIAYAVFYTLGFATFFYSIWVPLDLLIFNGIAQCISLALTGNTLHGNLAGAGTMNRDQYIERCKKRALELLEQGHLGQAVGSMASDLSRYPELRAMPELTVAALYSARQNDVAAVREWINGF